ncbi:hypothetical protein O6H91_06G055000 [Diphasiastrum complanatum]|uniref:Uncharacterized protein n=1 Tax=Diphasiastrum complanatum TaxID=34168 RepID=A0ACC2DER2_DIPCM|nr:hypothetical protein O6H91_06G055000 [Diphasiastrum complanatum]
MQVAITRERERESERASERAGVYGVTEAISVAGRWNGKNGCEYCLCQLRARITTQGSLEDHESLVTALRKVDIVISTIAEENLLEQLNLVRAIKEVGTIRRFLPSEFGSEIDKVHKVHNVLEPVEAAVLAPKREIRRAVEAAGIPYTCIISNAMASVFLSCLGQYGRTAPPTDNVVILGDGNAKVIWVDEADIAKCTLKAMTDPRAVNMNVHIRPAANILSMNEVVQIWEKKIGKTLEKTFIPEEDFVKRIRGVLNPKKAL